MTKQMRIALVLPGFSAHPNDWAIPALQNLVAMLVQHHKLHIFSQRYPAKGVYQFNGVTHHALGGGQRFGAASLKIWQQTARAIALQHRKTPFDVIHAFWADEAGFSAALAGAKINRPVIVSLGGGELVSLPHINYGAQRFLARRLTTGFALKRASLITAGSAHQLNMCRNHQIPDKKLRTAPLGVDTQRFQPKTDLPAVGPVVVQAASLLPVKNQTLLLEIIGLVKEEIPAITLHLAGSGPEKERLAKLAHHLDLSQTIKWCGQISYPQMAQFFQQTRLYLQTSLHESQGMAVLEAMACGLPVLGTPVGITNTVACLATNWDKNVLANQIIKIMHNQEQYQEFRTQARQTAESRFSLPVTIDNFINLYGELA